MGVVKVGAVKVKNVLHTLHPPPPPVNSAYPPLREEIWMWLRSDGGRIYIQLVGVGCVLATHLIPAHQHGTSMDC